MENALKATCVQLLQLTHACFAEVYDEAEKRLNLRRNRNFCAHTESNSLNLITDRLASLPNRDQTGITVVK